MTLEFSSCFFVSMGPFLSVSRAIVICEAQNLFLVPGKRVASGAFIEGWLRGWLLDVSSYIVIQVQYLSVACKIWKIKGACIISQLR